MTMTARGGLPLRDRGTAMRASEVPEAERGVWRGCAYRRGMYGAPSWREPAGAPDQSQPPAFTQETTFGNSAQLERSTQLDTSSGVS